MSKTEPSGLQVLHRRLPLVRAVLLDFVLAGAFVRLEDLDLVTVHELDYVISLVFLETHAQSLMAVVFVVGLVFVVLDLDKVGVFGGRVEGESDDGVDRGGFGDNSKRP